MRKAAKTILHDDAGFTLAELLVTVIFAGLLSIAVGAGLSAALAAHGSNSQATHANALLSQTVSEVSDQLSFALMAHADGSFVNVDTRTQVRFSNTPVAGDETGIFLIGEGIATGAQSQESVLVIPAAHGLVPEISGVTYNEDSQAWSYTIRIMGEGGTIVDQKTMSTTWLGK